MADKKDDERFKQAIPNDEDFVQAPGAESEADDDPEFEDDAESEDEEFETDTETAGKE